MKENNRTLELGISLNDVIVYRGLLLHNCKYSHVHTFRFCDVGSGSG